MDDFSARELAKKYNHTYALIKMKKTGESIPVYFDTFNVDDEGRHYCKFLTKRDKRQTHFLKDFTISPIPNRHVFEFEGKTLVYSRLPSRQWRKGLCNDNATLFDPVVNLISYLPSSQLYEFEYAPSTKICMAVLFGMYETQYARGLNEAIFKIMSSDSLSRAIDEKYHVTVFPSESKPYLLFRYNIPLAFYNNKTDTFTLVNKIYTQEITDFCNRGNLKSYIEG